MKKLLILSIALLSGLANAKSLIGVTEPFETIKISSNVDGIVTTFNKELGEKLSSSEVLVKIDDEEKIIEKELAALSLAQSYVNLENFNKKAERYKALSGSKNVSISEYDDALYESKSATNDIKIKKLELKNKARIVRDTTIFGADNYIVSKRNIDVGDYVQASSILYEVINIDSLKVKVNVNSKELKKLPIGTVVNVALSEDSKETVEGVVINVGLLKESSLFSYPVYIKINNEKKEIPISETVFVYFEDNE